MRCDPMNPAPPVTSTIDNDSKVVSVKHSVANFAETSYGIVKRLQIIDDWLVSAGRPLHILDYGCGTGEHVTFPLAEAGHVVLGVDVHERSIEQARSSKRLPNLEFRVSTSQPIGKENDFDAIICSEVLEHLAAPADLLAFFYSRLNADGRLIITTPNGRGAYEILCALERYLHRVGLHQVIRSMKSPAEAKDTKGFLNTDSRHVQFFSLKQLNMLFNHAGFKVIDRRPRTLVCGPYADLLFQWLPFRDTLIRLNSIIADKLPMRCAADWMFLLSKM